MNSDPELTVRALLLEDKELLKKLIQPINLSLLSTRARNGLNHEMFLYVGDLVTQINPKSPPGLHFGKKSAAEIQKIILDPLGLDYEMDIPAWPDRKDPSHNLIITGIKSALFEAGETLAVTTAQPPAKQPSDLSTARGRLQALRLPRSLRPRL